MRVLALDPATITGVADGIAGGNPVLSIVHLRTSADDDFDDMMGRAAEWMLTRLRTDPPRVLVLEKPVPPFASRDFDSTRMGLGLDGLWTGLARASGVYVRHAPIQSWRKGVLGNGRIKGADAKRRMLGICKSLGWPAADHNAAEAAGI